MKTFECWFGSIEEIKQMIPFRNDKQESKFAKFFINVLKKLNIIIHQSQLLIVIFYFTSASSVVVFSFILTTLE